MKETIIYKYMIKNIISQWGKKIASLGWISIVLDIGMLARLTVISSEIE